MIRLSNIRIGTKLAAASGLSILLVLGMMVSQWINTRNVDALQEVATRQSSVVVDAVDAKADARGLVIAMRDLRLANDAKAAEAAKEFLEARYKSLTAFADGMIAKSRTQENKNRVEALKAEAEKFMEVSRDMVKNKEATFVVLSRAIAGELNPPDEARFKQLTRQFDQMARERGMPAAESMIKVAEAIADRSREITRDRTTQAEAAKATAEYINMALTGFTVLVLIAIAIFGAMSIAKPMRALVKPLDELAQGNFAIQVPATKRGDEVGQISEAMRMMADKVRSTIAEVKSSAREVTNASVEISSATTDLSQRTEEQAASLEQTSASMEEISATVKKNAENAQQANASAAQTREVADRGGEVVAQAVGAMAKIEESSRKISDIIGVIDEIARQTNLLALNAAVEAARAGEAGRGFAVVASEVRSLAQRSSQAAKDIKDLITNSNSQVKDGVALVNQAGNALQEIVESIKQVAAIVSDIANASIEQSTGIEQVNRALTQMDEVTQQNSALVEENAATAKTLEHQAKSMDEQVAFFQIDMAAGAEGMTHAKAVAATPIVAKAVTVQAKVVEAKPVAVAAAPKDMPKAQPNVAPKRMAAAGGARRMQSQLATAMKADAEWKEF
ncbi:MAG: methyl-accepting chemotaxis protein [Pseudomonadota bacterium]